MSKGPEFPLKRSSTSGVRNWAYFWSTGSGFRDKADFQNCHIGAWNLVSGQSAIICTYTLFLPQRVEIELIFALWAAVSKIRANYLTCHIWAWNLASGQSSSSCTFNILFLPQGVEVEVIFALLSAVSEIQSDFQNCLKYVPKTSDMECVSGDWYTLHVYQSLTQRVVSLTLMKHSTNFLSYAFRTGMT